MTPTYTISGLENIKWSDMWTAPINPVEAASYGHVQTGGKLLLNMNSNVPGAPYKPYGGWLCKNAIPLPVQAATIAFNYSVEIDEATLQCAQVIETDLKITDFAGWTYDGSFQWNISKGWLAQIGSPWQDTSVGLAAPPTPHVALRVQIQYVLDYTKHTITVASVSINGAVQKIGVTTAAKQIGWTAGQLIAQLQQCNNNIPGFYTLAFSDIGYKLQ